MNKKILHTTPEGAGTGDFILIYYYRLISVSILGRLSECLTEKITLELLNTKVSTFWGTDQMRGVRDAIRKFLINFD